MLIIIIQQNVTRKTLATSNKSKNEVQYQNGKCKEHPGTIDEKRVTMSTTGVTHLKMTAFT
ncbi:unnamed protein product, partial [Acanthoscelides obtectus]